VTAKLTRVAVASALGALTLAGCAVGPDFHTPDPPQSTKYTPEPLPAQTASAATLGGSAQQFNPSAALPADWWTLFHSPALDELVRQAIKDSPNLAAAQAALRSAELLQRAEAGALFVPKVDANGSAVRQHEPGYLFGQPQAPSVTYNLFSASANVSYRLDLFGGSRRLYESYRAQSDYQHAELEAAYIALTANIVTAAINEASLRGQLSELDGVLTNERAVLKVVERQFEAGGASRTDVLAQRAQLAQTEATVPALHKSLAQVRNQLAVLSGRTPDRGDIPEFTLDQFTLPETLPVSLPSEVVRQRPDIQAAEALLHQASAEVGVATANLYPQIDLTASLGLSSLAVHSLVSKGNELWSVGGSLTQPLFHAGELRNKKRAAEANFDQAFATYREVVLSGLGDVANVLLALEYDADALRAQTDAEAQAKATFDLAQKQYHVGGVSYLTILNAERQYDLARQARVQVAATRYADTAALFLALGGGWWSAPAQSASNASGTPPADSAH
jgi:NodT family efflux transporter outer membrane factor (OMF) lipoprotein